MGIFFEGRNAMFSSHGKPKTALSRYFRDIRNAESLFCGCSNDSVEFGDYLKKIHYTDQYIDEDHEIELFRRFKIENDLEAKDLILKAHLPFVVRIAKRIERRIDKNVMLDDLIQSGNVGLLTAMQDYDFDRGIRFFVYAKKRIGTMIWREVFYTSYTVRISRSVQEMMNLIRAKYPKVQWSDLDVPSLEDVSRVIYDEYIDRFLKKYGKAPDDEQRIDAHWEIKFAYAQLLIGDNFLTGFGDNKNEDDAFEFCANKYDSPMEILVFNELCQEVKKFLETLPPLTAKMLKKYLLEDEFPAEISANTTVPVEKVRKIIWDKRVLLKRQIETKILETESMENILKIFQEVPSLLRSLRKKKFGFASGDTRKAQVVDEIARRLSLDEKNPMKLDDLALLASFQSKIARQNLSMIKLIEIAKEKILLRN